MKAHLFCNLFFCVYLVLHLNLTLKTAVYICNMPALISFKNVLFLAHMQFLPIYFPELFQDKPLHESKLSAES